MIAVAHDQKRLGWKFPRQPRQQCAVVPRRHALAANVFLDIGRIAEITEVRRELGTQASVPREMIGDIVDVEEERPVAALALEQF